jgi:hypothetical protein
MALVPSIALHQWSVMATLQQGGVGLLGLLSHLSSLKGSFTKLGGGQTHTHGIWTSRLLSSAFMSLVRPSFLLQSVSCPLVLCSHMGPLPFAPCRSSSPCRPGSSQLLVTFRKQAVGLWTSNQLTWILSYPGIRQAGRTARRPRDTVLALEPLASVGS